MQKPQLSKHFMDRVPSPIRLSQIEFLKRKDNVYPINTAIGDVSLPMHPAMQKRMFNLNSDKSPFKDGVVRYTETVGTDESRAAFLNIIKASGFNTDGIYMQITEGGSQAMELIVVGCCGRPGTTEKPLLLIDASYTNYISMAKRTGRGIVSITRFLNENNKFSLPDVEEIKKKIEETDAGAMVIIPYDNPTGYYYDHETMVRLAKVCTEKNIWIISDEAYRGLHYTGQPASSIWGITENEVPGITGRRISIESVSKVWNACGLRIGALATDNKKFHEQAIAENTANLCPSAIGQYIFGAMAHVSVEEIQKWYEKQRNYYKKMMTETTTELRKRLPGVIASNPDASVYSVVDVRNIAKPGFDSQEFVLYCAREGLVNINGRKMTLFTAPMAGFYNHVSKEKNPGVTQIRIAYVCPPEEMKLVPELFEKLFRDYEAKRK
jgi:aspartate aminotransferase